jgi:hypothetical protein
LGGTIPAEAGLADVVCGAFRYPSQSLVPTVRCVPARGSAGGDLTVCFESVSQSAAAFHPGSSVRLSFHGLGYSPDDGCHMEPRARGGLSSCGKSEEIDLLQKRFQGLHHDVGNENVAVGVGMDQILQSVFGITGHTFEKEWDQGQIVLLS